ncbi:TetR/AcrR family transcriptional regulator [Sutcliffiella deserti]|uniref:TetR/AcrR family transcriptional regulator n=1 Tax=Sutcliffiella deserti TaxID=2875501 RepID=UPI001CC15BDF|nr:TetR/AcrR family transcriptional regulator [Sutcliffiella deserti]
MNDRKQHVITCAHKLFVEKGFQATSIQEILDYSSISKGTFYNYFSSKNELLIELFKTLYKKMEHERNELLIGQDSSDLDIFIRQVELQMETNRTNKLISLFEEVYFLKDEELKAFIRQGQIKLIHWIYHRFLDIFGKDKQPYLLDCAIMFMGILNHNIKFYAMAYETKVDIHRVVRFSAKRLEKMVYEVSGTGDSLLQPEILARWLPDHTDKDNSLKQQILKKVILLKQTVPPIEEGQKYIELLDFIHDEILHSKKPRYHLISSSCETLKKEPTPLSKQELLALDKLISAFFQEKN